MSGVPKPSASDDLDTVQRATSRLPSCVEFINADSAVKRLRETVSNLEADSKRLAELNAQLSAIDNGPPGAPDYSKIPSFRDCSHFTTSAFDFARSLEAHIIVDFFTNQPRLDENAFRDIEERDEKLRRQGDKRTVAALRIGK